MADKSRPAPSTRWENRKTHRIAVVLRSRIRPDLVFYQYEGGGGGGQLGIVVEMKVERFHAAFVPCDSLLDTYCSHCCADPCACNDEVYDYQS